MAASEGGFGGESSDGAISGAETVVFDWSVDRNVRSVDGSVSGEVASGIPGMVSIVDGIVGGGTFCVAVSALLFALFRTRWCYILC